MNCTEEVLLTIPKLIRSSHFNPSESYKKLLLEIPDGGSIVEYILSTDLNREKLSTSVKKLEPNDNITQ